MYLKSIEIQGFKSFAKKTILNFNNGVTAIVGPNGSGKSNIADAVRWVLGEQKVKQLRGASMQDVIFAGTEARKPQGFAYVCITIDNSDGKLPVDYSEVSVSRRLYRSGESEYMINGQAVRLRDVQELFFDTGIGKEGYSIIGQGQIDAILSGKPEDRRGLFDEAAGITKFKRRKVAAVKHLEEERANLLRITDILNELESRVKPLERQSKAAREYLTLRDDLKIYELNMFLRDSEGILKNIDKYTEDLEIVKNSLRETTEENDKLKEESGELSELLRSSEELLSEKREELQKAELLIQNLNSQIEVSETEINAENTNIEHYDTQLKRIEKEIADNRKTLVSYRSSLKDLYNNLELIVSEDEAETTQAELKAEIGRLLSRITAIIGEDDSDNDENASKETEDSAKMSKDARASEADADSDDIEDEDDDFSFVMPDWLKAIKNKRNDLANVEEKENRTSSWIKDANDELNKLNEEQRANTTALSDIEKEMSVLKTRRESLKNIAERYEGYGESVRSVMKRKQDFKGIKGVVADLIRTKKEYETAVETALGGRIQNIVTSDEKTARELIEYLKKNKLGRATFLPLDAITSKDQSEYQKATSENGVIGLADSIVEADREYSELVKYLLGGFLVVDNVDNALKIANKYKHSLRIVTLDGELLSPGGSIAGGAYRNNSNLMGRAREIEDIDELISKTDARLDDIKAKIQAKEKLISAKSKELSDLNNQMREIIEEKNELSFGIMSDMKLQYSGFKQKTEFLSDNIEKIVIRMKDTDSEYETMKTNKSESLSRIEEKKRNIELRREDIEKMQEGIQATAKIVEEETKKKEELSGSQSEYFSKKEELSDNILKLQKEVIRVENLLEKEQTKLDDKADYIWNEYELTVSGAKKFLDPDLGSNNELKSHINELKGRIKELGPINISAIEEYKEVSERYEFLSSQHKDLVESENSILSVIDELDAGMKKQFADRFEVIRTEFTKAFRELFGGGQADLELVIDPEDVNSDELEAGILINAQPPGKKLQNMMQLSGGEKALTAIALLFAIQNMKPSPFCLLDEIEAALDDSNVIRFSDYLHKLTRYTQFIVITHRRGTMESADRLYGVTMQEKGITALVSVDLVSDQLS